MQKLVGLSLLFGLLLLSCNTQKNASTPGSTNLNALTNAEQKDGWKLLFDGKSTDGWRKFKSDEIGNSWIIEDGALTFDPTVKDGGDIITDGTYQNFELALEWKISECGNSGIMFNVQEEDQYGTVWQTGPEIQVLDNSCHPDAKIHKHRAGDLYDLIACSKETVKPAGQWNEVRIKIKDGKLENWLNGLKVVETQLWTDGWNGMVAGSKFKSMSGFGKYKSGHIALQDHGDKVAFRNIKIRML